MALHLEASNHKYRLVTSAAGDIDATGAWTELDPGTTAAVIDAGVTPATITTATSTDIIPIPSVSGNRRAVSNISVRNVHATVTNDVALVLDVGGTVYEIAKFTLKPGEAWFYEDGLGFFKVEAAVPNTGGDTNFATAASAAGFAADTYVANSTLKLDGLGAVRVGRAYHWRLIISKTGAGTATPILTVRVGTAGTTADTARLTFTWGAGTAAIDRGEIELDCVFTSIGSGTSAVLRGKANWTTNLQTTGLSNGVKALQVTSGGFDSTVANSVIGLSYNGGTSAVHTIEYVSAYTDDF